MLRFIRDYWRLMRGDPLLGEFVPCVAYYNEGEYTEMLLKDCFTVWCPLQHSAAHFVDLGYDQDDNLVGIRIWANVERRDRPTRGIYEGAALLEKLRAAKTL